MPTKNNLNDDLLGIRLMLQAAFAFSIMGLFVKLIGSNIPSMQVVFYRSFVGLLLTLVYAKKQCVNLKGHHHFLLLMRSLSGFIALFLFFYGIAHLPLGTAILLNYTAPFFVVIFSFIWMRERISMQTCFIIIMSFTGVFFLLQGEKLEWNKTTVAPLLSALFAGLAYTTIRSIRKRESHLTIIFYFTLISTILAALLCFKSYVIPSLSQLFFLSCIGVIAFYAQIWLTRSYRCAPAGVVSPFSYLTPLLSYSYGLIFWGEQVSLMGFMGIMLILTAGLLLTRIHKKN